MSSSPPPTPDDASLPPIKELSISDSHESVPAPVASTSALPSTPPRPSLPPRVPADVPITYRRYTGEEDIPIIIRLVETELSEPYNWYTYRYFLQDWPHLCFLAYAGNLPIGVIVCKQEVHRGKLNRGYLAMLSVLKTCRGRGVATQLVRLTITEMLAHDAEEVVLETEFDNVAALGFYKKLGFLRDKRLYRFYLNAKDAFRLKLPLGESSELRRRAARESVDEALAPGGIGLGSSAGEDRKGGRKRRSTRR